MIIAGAGGHGKEVLYSLHNSGYDVETICFFDENKECTAVSFNAYKIPVFSSLSELMDQLAKDPGFCLGVGAPISRRNLYNFMTKIGGQYHPLNFSGVENQSQGDLMPLTFLGPNVLMGKGALLNSGGQIHHDCSVGEFSEIGPQAMLLGGAKVGRFCRIGAGAVVLPGVKLGDEVVVGAGAVVTKNHLQSTVIKGVPAK
ncbi:DapH/DapD/GlmU-related protein [Algoriphagus sp. Y33]|uniref:PglD-related sugar-binding protein n=1 Tax=Algoriphagus sp. Y33 TaxID=2772483 RepID=UPI0017840C4D|nr:DapH/DapD/GlmU-related protein [Algoriphagus sp. Y33]